MDGATDALVAEVVEAAAERKWDELKLLLHPYLQWSENGGTVKLRGRTNVLRWLVEYQTPLLRPERVELRDGQIYRWIG
jgi:hypothetical protein